MVDFITPLISGALSLFSGFGAQSAAKKQQKLQAAYEYVNKKAHDEQQAANELNKQAADSMNRELGQRLIDKYSFANIAKDADAAGFNPVTWLSGLGSAYGAMQQAGYNLQVATPFFGTSYSQSAPTAQVPSTMQVVGNALQAGFNTYQSNARVEQSQAFQREMLETQIAAREVNNRAGRGVIAESWFGSGNIPYSVSAGGLTTGDRVAGMPVTSRTGGLSAVTPIGQSDWKSDDVKVSNPWADRQDVAPVANAEAWTNRYGESEGVESASAVKVMLDDISWRLNKRTFALGMVQNWRDLFGYPVLNDGARGLSWGRPDKGYNPGLLPGFGYGSGGSFGGETFSTGGQF